LTLNQIFGSNLRNHRKSRKLTQQGLAERVGVSVEMISKMERGIAAPSFGTLERLAAVLEVPEPLFFSIGFTAAPDGERGQLLQKIHVVLSRMNGEQLARAHQVLAALAG
jgi:transcriptional regulator with XRE-family HTH domain